jgi:hypothetical protein
MQHTVGNRIGKKRNQILPTQKPVSARSVESENPDFDPLGVDLFTFSSVVCLSCLHYCSLLLIASTTGNCS